MRVASTTLSVRACRALPRVENESIATRGSTPRSARPERAEETAISASSLVVGSGLTAASAKMKIPFSHYWQFGTTMMKKLDGAVMPSAYPTVRLAAFMTAAVMLRQPPTIPSASPSATIMAP